MIKNKEYRNAIKMLFSSTFNLYLKNFIKIRVRQIPYLLVMAFYVLFFDLSNTYMFAIFIIMPTVVDLLVFMYVMWSELKKYNMSLRMDSFSITCSAVSMSAFLIHSIRFFVCLGIRHMMG